VRVQMLLRGESGVAELADKGPRLCVSQHVLTQGVFGGEGFAADLAGEEKLMRRSARRRQRRTVASRRRRRRQRAVVRVYESRRDAAAAVIVRMLSGRGQSQRQHHVSRGHPGNGGRILVPVRRQGRQLVRANAHKVVDEASRGAGPTGRHRRDRRRMVEHPLSVLKIRSPVPVIGGRRMRFMLVRNSRFDRCHPG